MGSIVTVDGVIVRRLISVGTQGPAGVVAASAPITYDGSTQTVGIDASGFVASVNGSTGAVVLAAADVGADATGAAASAVSSHSGVTTSVHGITNTADLVVTSDARLSDARTPVAHSNEAHSVAFGTVNGSRIGGKRSGYFLSAINRTLLNRSNPVNEMYYTPITVDQQSTFDEISVHVITAVATATARLGVYNEDANGIPNSLVQDFGTVSANTTGTKSIAITLTLSPGRYWFVHKNEVAAATFRFYAGGSAIPGLADLRDIPFSLSAALGNITYRRDSGVVTGSLPSIGTPDFGRNFDSPVFSLRFA